LEVTFPSILSIKKPLALHQKKGLFKPIDIFAWFTLFLWCRWQEMVEIYVAVTLYTTCIQWLTFFLTSIQHWLGPKSKRPSLHKTHFFQLTFCGILWWERKSCLALARIMYSIFHLLKWDVHIRELRKRILKTIGGLKILRRKLTFKQAVTVVTSQALSILYYASPAWLTPAIGKKELTSLESIHYKALRVIVCDHRQRTNISPDKQTPTKPMVSVFCCILPHESLAKWSPDGTQGNILHQHVYKV